MTAVADGPTPWLWRPAARVFHPLEAGLAVRTAQRLCAHATIELPPGGGGTPLVTDPA